MKKFCLTVINCGDIVQKFSLEFQNSQYEDILIDKEIEMANIMISKNDVYVKGSLWIKN